MNASDFRKLYAYTDWANERMLVAAAELTNEQFTRTIVSSYASLRDTFAHIASAEWLWLERWKGVSHGELPAWMNDPSFDVLRERFRAVAEERGAYLEGLGDDAIDSILRYRSIKGDDFAIPLGETLLHCANHSTYHRGQLVTMLRQVGATPPNTDYTQFYRSLR